MNHTMQLDSGDSSQAARSEGHRGTMRDAIGIEFRKMHRLRTSVILAVMLAAVVALSSITLFSSSARADFDDPAAVPWQGLLMSFTMMAAMTSPILTAVLASRQTDIEHTGAGWMLAATAGFTPGALCRAKLAALSLVLAPAIVMQTSLIIGAGLIAGIRVPIDPQPWIVYTLLLYLMDMAFLALHIWLAATVDNQLISVGMGMLGAFIAVFMLLMPPLYARLLPWGYFAVISQVGTDGREIVYVTPPYAWIVGFLGLVAVLFFLATRRFDRIER